MATLKGGNHLEARLREMAAKVSKAAVLQVGFLEGSTGDDGKPLALRAAINEFGAPKAGIPPRPYFRNMIASKSGEWPDAVGELLVDNDYDAAKTLGVVGESIAFQLQQSIIDTNEPALSPITVMLRGMRSKDSSLVVTGKTVGEAAERVAAGKTNYGASTKPLVDTGDMLRGISSIVK
jgi:hypothetical protein